MDQLTPFTFTRSFYSFNRNYHIIIKHKRFNREIPVQLIGFSSEWSSTKISLIPDEVFSGRLFIRYTVEATPPSHSSCLFTGHLVSDTGVPPTKRCSDTNGLCPLGRRSFTTRVCEFGNPKKKKFPEETENLVNCIFRKSFLNIEI